MSSLALPAIPDRYTGPAVVLHWLIAALIVVNVILIYAVDYVPEDWIRLTIDTHKSTGITVLGLVLMRILWRATHPPPPMPSGYARWERLGANAAHGVLYALMLLLPLSGWMHDSAWKDADVHPMRLFGLVPWPRIGLIQSIEPAAKLELHKLFGWFHEIFGYLLYGLLALHVGGALKHQWLDREPELQRMSLKR